MCCQDHSFSDSTIKASVTAISHYQTFATASMHPSAELDRHSTGSPRAKHAETSAPIKTSWKRPLSWAVRFQSAAHQTLHQRHCWVEVACC